MARPFTHDQARENDAFLAALRRTGNARAAAAELGVHRSTYTKRRAKHPDFAHAWDAALAAAHARLHGHGTARRGREDQPSVVRAPSGRMQLRRATPGKLTRADEQAFLSALSATCNVRLSAAAAGFSHSAFYARARRDPGFAREWRLALQQGYDALELALLASWTPDSHAHDQWRHNAPPPVPPMTSNQALQLMYLHQKEARLEAEPPHYKLRRGESEEARSVRLGAMWEERMQRDRERFLLAEAEHREKHGRPSGFGPPILPDLSQVTGWSKADRAKLPVHDDRALFGGFRIEDLPKEQQYYVRRWKQEWKK